MRTWDQLVTAPALPLDASEVLTDHLRSADPSAEYEYVSGLIATAYRMAERRTRRALMPQTWALLLEGFPGGALRLPRPPLLEVVSIEYIDDAGAEQTLATSAYQVRQPTGPYARYGEIWPAVDSTWPSTQAGRIDAVTVTYRCGYTDGGSPEAPAVPQDILHGMLLVIGELYKQRSESVHAINQNPALIRARSLWDQYAVF